MKIKKAIKNYKLILAVTATVLIAIAAYMFFSVDRSAAPVKSDYPLKTGTITDEALDSSENKEEVASDAKVNSLTPVINSAMYNEDKTVSVRAMVAEAKEGKCSLRITSPSGVSTSQQVDLVLAPSYYACQGFEIPSNQVNEKGQWTVEVAYINSNGVSSAYVERKVEVY
ncbi:hypothetical protein EON76_01465 [bacterium]|nr:MAG: hypothetical protein EON76_01465 [bacterium]